MKKPLGTGGVRTICFPLSYTFIPKLSVCHQGSQGIRQQLIKIDFHPNDDTHIAPSVDNN